MSLSRLTDEQRRLIQDYTPNFSNRPPSFDLAAFLDALVDASNGIVSGNATITGAATTAVIALDPALDGSPVIATLTDPQGAADFVSSATWDGSGNLTITLNTAPGGVDVATVSYVVDAR